MNVKNKNVSESLKETASQPGIPFHMVNSNRKASLGKRWVGTNGISVWRAF